MSKNIESILFNASFDKWWLSYASEVITFRAIPHLIDGFKPVQRRIMYTMNQLDDGKFSKVTKTAGFCLQYHEHGDGSVEEALFAIAQKNYLMDTQGAFGAPVLGNYDHCAGRYGEVRLSKFANDVLFSPKVTNYKPSYDGRSVEPVFLPVKFPILLAQGAEGIAVSLACKILPHNFNEICDAAMKYLSGEDFELYPDFPTGGFLDYSNYNDGLRGGKLVCRAKIEPLDKKTIVIREIPFTTSCDSIRDSIVKAVEKGKIKIKKVEDNSSEFPEILIHHNLGDDQEKLISALYAFTDCQITISPNACVIYNEKPEFLGVHDILKFSVDYTKEILCKELNVKLDELKQKLHRQLLEKLFIENKIYKEMENAESYDEAYDKVKDEIDKANAKASQEYAVEGEITHEDIVFLTELRFKKLTKYDKNSSEAAIKQLNKDIKATQKNIKNIVQFTIDWFAHLKEKYGKKYPRKTVLTEPFKTVVSTSVVANNAKLYADFENGFIGYGDQMKKSGAFIDDCADVDNILCISRDGDYGIIKASDKAFFKKDLVYVGVYKKDKAKEEVFNIVYRDGAEGGKNYVKRCTIESLTLGKIYNLCKGNPSSEVFYISKQAVSDKAPKVYAYIAKPRKGVDTKILDFNEHNVKWRGASGVMFYGNRKVLAVTKDKREPNALF